MEVHKFTSTNVRTALKCPRLFILTKKYKTSIPYTAGMGVGNLVHNTLDDYIKTISEVSDFPTYFTKSMNKEEIQSVNEKILYGLYYKRLKRRYNKIRRIDIAENAWKLLSSSTRKFATIIKKGLDRFPIEEIPRRIILGSERPFQISIPIKDKKFILTGRIDLLLRDPESDEITIFDYKTGNSNQLKLDALQMYCYSLGIKKDFDEDHKIKILYLRKDDVKEVEIPSSEDVKVRLYDLLFKMADWLERDTKSIPKGKCETCLLKEKCDKIFDNIESDKNVKNEIIKSIDNLTGTKPPLLESTKIKIGNNFDNNKPVTLTLGSFTKHIALLGSTGSGKTVLSKVIIEEMLNKGISALLIDPQGDLSSLALPKDKEGKDLLEKVDVSIFTPGSEKGKYLALDPFADPPSKMDLGRVEFNEYRNAILDNISLNLLAILNLEPKNAKAEKSFLEAIIKEIWNRGERPSFKNIATLAESIEEVTTMDGDSIPVKSLLPNSKRKNICSQLFSYAVGIDGLLFKGGTSIPLDEIGSGNPKLFIVHLGSVGTDVNKRINVLSWILRSIYNWMFTNPPEDGGKIPRLLFYIDEVVDFMPIHPYNPPSKRMLDLLLRQSRKYGVSCMFATQSPGSIEYRALDNVLSILVGRTPTKQSNTKIQNIIGPKIENSLNRNKLTERLMKAKKGEFMIVSEDGIPQYFKSRMPYTQHKVLSVEDVGELYKNEKIT